MRHRHSGPKVAYRTRRGNIRLRERPTHSQMERYKNLNYNQLRKGFKIPAYEDDDKDGVINKYDCRPWDRKKQDTYGRYDSDKIDNPATNALHPDSLTPEQASRHGLCHEKADEWARRNKGQVLRSETGEHSIAKKGNIVYDYVLGFEGNIDDYLSKVPHEFSDIKNYENEEE